MTNSTRITLRQVAKHANVSLATASRVLNNNEQVDELTRHAVWNAAQSLGYSLDYLRKQATVPRSVLLLALGVAPTYENSEGAAQLTGAVERVFAAGVQSVFQKENVATRVERNPMSPTQIEGYVSDPNITGIIILGGTVNRPFISALQKSGFPFVVLGSHVAPLAVNCVLANYADGIVQAVNHLIDGGRHKLAFVNGPATTSSSAEKLNGFRLALAQHDQLIQPERVVSTGFSTKAGYQAVQELLQRAPDVDAIVFADDSVAIGGLRAIRDTGRRVPDDIAITGFYDIEISHYTEPPLTTVHIDQFQMGAIAARRLRMLLSEPDGQAWSIMTPTTLVVRKSS